MKRIIFGFCVIALAAATAAFTTPTVKHGNLTDSYFEFDYGNYLPTQANVEDESKWVQVADLGTCNSANIKACRMRVSPTFVSGSNLLPTTNIIAHISSGSVAYVFSANAVQIANKN